MIILTLTSYSAVFLDDGAFGRNPLASASDASRCIQRFELQVRTLQKVHYGVLRIVHFVTAKQGGDPLWRVAVLIYCSVVRGLFGKINDHGFDRRLLRFKPQA